MKAAGNFDACVETLKHGKHLLDEIADPAIIFDEIFPLDPGS